MTTRAVKKLTKKDMEDKIAKATLDGKFLQVTANTNVAGMTEAYTGGVKMATAGAVETTLNHEKKSKADNVNYVPVEYFLGVRLVGTAENVGTFLRMYGYNASQISEQLASSLNIDNIDTPEGYAILQEIADAEPAAKKAKRPIAEDDTSARAIIDAWRDKHPLKVKVKGGPGIKMVQVKSIAQKYKEVLNQPKKYLDVSDWELEVSNAKNAKLLNIPIKENIGINGSLQIGVKKFYDDKNHKQRLLAVLREIATKPSIYGEDTAQAAADYREELIAAYNEKQAEDRGEGVSEEEVSEEAMIEVAAEELGAFE